jgi:branched-chain amino acid transport system substrate-binding protein
MMVVALVVLAAGCSRGPDLIRVGAVYPLSGSQGPGGVEEYQGVRLAVEMANGAGGVDGRPIQLDPVDVAGSDAASQAVALLASRGDRLVLGSYGSTISQPAGAEAVRRGMLFWETGAVGSMPGPGPGRLFFRVAPSGVLLGQSAVTFVARQLAPLLHRDPSTLRFAVANVNDLYGSAVAQGAVNEIHTLGLRFAGQFPYGLDHFDPPAVIRSIARAKPDVLFVSAYLDDGIALRREMVHQKLRLVANIGSSSSYCMPAFGAALGKDAVGLYASDKPDANALDLSGLTPTARDLLQRARAQYRAEYHQDMSAPALAGFSAAWALVRSVMPKAAAITPQAVAAAALSVRIPEGGLPNGSGLEFGGPSSPDPGANLRAASVIWEWTWPTWRGVVWPPQFATEPIRAIPIDP